MSKLFIFLVAVTAAMLALLACEETRDEPSTSAPAQESPTASAAEETPALPASAEIGGGAPPYYLEPILLVPGDYVDSSFPFEAVAERGLAVAEAEKDKPKFQGMVNGFRLYSFERAFEDPSVEKNSCVAVEFPLTDELKFNYLPPGTFARSPQFAGKCSDGSTAFVMQSFVTKHGTFDISYQPGERAFGHDASAERVSATTVAGRPGVIIRPLVEEGFGQSWVAFATGNGFIVVDARNLPLSETLKIAEGVKCASC